MKSIKFYIGFMLTFLLNGCTKDFESINKNNNAPTQMNAATLLPSAIFEPINPHMTMQMWLTDQIMHYYVRRNDNQLDVYNFAVGATDQARLNDFWRVHYAAISNINDMITVATEQKSDAYVAAGKILKAYYLANVTEMWIDAPASLAGKGAENSTPAYDTQQSIYKSVLKDLDDANALLTATTKFVAGGDVLFKGDATKWKKMANSLRLRYLLRLSNKAEINAAAEISKIVSSPATYPIIMSNADAAIYDFTGVSPNVSTVATQSITVFSGLSMSKRMEETYNVYGDPRMDFFFRKPINAATYPTHQGVPNGILRETAQSWNGNGDAHTSLLTTRFVTTPASLDYTFISHAEVQFILAEAAMKGWITTPTTAKQYYEAGITGNFAQWGLTVPSGFFALPQVEWNATMERLMDQKWLAFFYNNTLESWGEQKRTGLPVLKVGSQAATVAGGKTPTRAFYPTLEQSINATNYKEAASRIGGDKIDAKHWYQN
jgi:hypothetical protein